MRVFLAALLPVDGRLRRLARTRVQRGLDRDEHGRSYWPDVETAAERLYPDLDRETQRWAFPQLRRQAPLDPHEHLPDGATCRYVATRATFAVAPMAARGGAPSVLGVEPIELDAGHFPMLTAPGGAGRRARDRLA